MKTKVFGTGRTETDEEARARYQRERQETHDLLERLAKEEIGAVHAKQADWLQQLKDAHQADRDGYSFDCKKHGGFLTLFITRSANQKNPKHSWGGEPEKVHASTINLSLCKQFKLHAGHAPDYAGEARFGYTLSGRESGWSSADGEQPAPEGQHFIIIHPECPLQYSRPLVSIASSGGGNHCSFGSSGPYEIRTRVTNAARGAEDDRIYFVGADATLFAPAGMGQQVLDRILAELASDPVPKIEIKV